MAFKKGMKKVPGSGRKKGISNKPRLISISEFLNDNNINPLAHLLNIIQKEDLKPYEKANIWMFIMTYAYPKPREQNVEEIDISIAEKFKDVSSEDLKESIRREETECSNSKSTSCGIDLTSLSNSTEDKMLSTDATET